MRLTCPNCDAQYEVDSAMIPVSGRDVQCSSCGKTWFQGPQEALAPEVPLESVEADVEAEEHGKSGSGLDEGAAAFFEGRAGDTEADDAEDSGDGAGQSAHDDGREDDAPSEEQEDTTSEDLIRAITSASDEEPDVEDAEGFEEDDGADAPAVVDMQDAETTEAEPEPAEPEPHPTDVAAQDDLAAEHADEDEVVEPEAETLHEDEDFEPAPPPRDRQTLDSNVLGILKAEAEREIAQRRAEESGLVETQPDLGLSEPTNRRSDPEDVSARTARLRGSSEESRDESRQREMLPDIDDINASLTATSDRPADQAPPVPADAVLKRRAGFRVGFTAVMIAVVALIVLYLNAPQIARAMPTLEAPLASYVDWANAMRLGLDGFLSQTVDAITGSGSNPS